MAAAVRSALYHVGQLERQEGRVQRVWERQEDMDNLCEEMIHQAELMEPAPKRLLEVRGCTGGTAAICMLVCASALALQLLCLPQLWLSHSRVRCWVKVWRVPCAKTCLYVNSDLHFSLPSAGLAVTPRDS